MDRMLITRLSHRPGLHRAKPTHTTPKTPREPKHEFTTLLASITHGLCGDSLQLWGLSLTNTVTRGKLVNLDESLLLQLPRCKELINVRNYSKEESQHKCLADRDLEGLYPL